MYTNNNLSPGHRLSSFLRAHSYSILWKTLLCLSFSAELCNHAQGENEKSQTLLKFY